MGSPDDVSPHLIVEKRDPTRSLPGMIDYVVRSQGDPALPAAKAICPTGAVQEERHTGGVGQRL